MSSTALMWAAGIAPVADVQEYAILVRMSDEADESGCGVYLSTATIAEDIKVSEKTVQRRLDAMEERKLIGRGDQALAARIRADRRPVVYDLLIPATCFADLARTNRRRAEKDLPPITEQTRPVQDPPAADAMRARRSDIGKPRRKLDEHLGHVDDHGADGVTGSPLVHGVTTSPPATGGLVVRDGVTGSPPRGDYQSPNPGIDPGIDPGVKTSSSLTAADRPAPGPQEEEDEPEKPTLSEQAGLLLTTLLGALGVEPSRQPYGTRRSRLEDRIAARLDAGWTPEAVSSAVGESLAGASSVYAVLSHRLDQLPAEPPRPALPAQREAEQKCDRGPAHLVYPARNCPICVVAAEDSVVVQDAFPAGEGRAAARQVAARSGSRVANAAVAS